MFSRILSLCLLLALSTGLLTGCSKQAKVQRLLERADKEFEAERYDRAEILYGNALQLDPSQRALEQLSRVYYNQGRWIRALGFQTRAVELYPTNLPGRLRLARIMVDAGVPQRAGEHAFAVLNKGLITEESLFLAARAATKSNDITLVQDFLARAGNTRERAAARLASAILLRKNGKTEEADAELTTALKLDPKLPDAYIEQADVFRKRGETNNVLWALEAAVTNSPLRSQTRIVYARNLFKQGRTNEVFAVLNSIVEKAPDYVPALVMLAEISIARDDLAAGSNYLSQVYLCDRRNIEADLYRAKMLLMTDEPDQAIALVQRAASYREFEAEAQKIIAAAHLQKRDTGAAITSLLKAVQAAPEDEDAALEVGELTRKTGDYLTSVNILTDLLARSSNNITAKASLALTYGRMRNFDRAAALLNEILAKHPASIPAHQADAEISLMAGQPKKAIAAYGRLAQLLPDFPGIPFKQAMIYYHMRELDEAIKIMEAASQRFPDDFTVSATLIDYYNAVKRFDDALRRAEDLVGKHKDRGIALSVKAHVFDEMGNAKQAEAVYLEAIKAEPGYLGAYIGLADLYVKTGRNEQAIQTLDRLLSQNPKDAGALFRTGFLHQQIGNYAAATNAYERILTVRATDEEEVSAMNNLANIYADALPNLDRAMMLAEATLRKATRSSAAKDTLAWVLFKRGEYARALELINEAARDLGDIAEFRYHEGMVNYMLLNKDQARKSLEVAVNSQADYKGIETARKYLDRLNLESAPLPELVKHSSDDPNDPMLLSFLANAQIAARDYAAAAASYEKFLKLQPGNTSLMSRLAELNLVHLNNPVRAFELVSEAYKTNPDDPKVCTLLGKITFQRGDHARALPILERGALRSSEPELLYNLAWAYFTQGRVADALATMRRVPSDANPTLTSDAENFIAMAQAITTPLQLDSVKPKAQQLLQKAPKYVPALFLSALIEEQAGSFKSAAGIHESVLAIYPAFSPAIRNLALLYANQLSDSSKAMPLLRRARESFPDDPALRDALEKLSKQTAVPKPQG